jgi:prevent-host-death family protein
MAARISAREFRRCIGDVSKRACREPIFITNQGGGDLVLLSATEYARLQRAGRRVHLTSEFPGAVSYREHGSHRELAFHVPGMVRAHALPCIALPYDHNFKELRHAPPPSFRRRCDVLRMAQGLRRNRQIATIARKFSQL